MHQYAPLSNYFLQIEASPNRPNDSESTYLRAQIKIDEDDLHCINVNLAVLLARRSRVIRRLGRYRGTLAPYSKLPPELIMEIVRFCGVREIRPLPSPSGSNDLRLRLTQICSSWRRVAFEMPELWNVHFEEHPTESRINLVAAWFNQCSSTEIHLTMEKWRRPKSLIAKSLLGEVVIPYAHRFKTLGSVLTPRGYLYSLPFDVLTTLSIRYSPWKTNPGEFMFAPLLRSVTITEVDQLISAHRVPPSLPHLPWKQLTSLCMEGSLTFGDIHELLSRCTFLENARFCSITDNSPKFSLDMLVLPHLKDLRIIFDSLTSADGLCSLDTPNLASLITNLPPIAPEFLEKFIAFMATFKRSLRHFELDRTGIFTIKAPVERIIHALPFLTHFITKEQYIEPSTLAMIGRRELLPNLKALQFKAQRQERVDDILDNLIPPDIIHKTNLRSVCIHAAGTRDPNLSRRIENLLSLDISIELL